MDAREAAVLDRTLIGRQSEPRSILVEAGHLTFFAEATGDTNPIYRDEGAAQASGLRALPAPPTFLFCLASLAPEKTDMLDLLAIDIGQVLHGEQWFFDLKPIYAGDTISLTSRISDIYDKKGGALDFVVLETEAENQHGKRVGVSRTVCVVRNG